MKTGNSEGRSVFMNIGEAAAASGVSAKMIRYYESIGLVPNAARSASGYRVYSDDDVHALRFIRRSRDLGFSVEQMGELLALWSDRSRASGDVKRIALNHVAELERKMRELRDMANTLRHLAENCHGDGRPHCPILEDLSCGHAPAPPKPRPTRRQNAGGWAT
jgi:Cu(I)-responsive transcriptional regulator